MDGTNEGSVVNCLAMTKPIVTCSPDILGGTAVFAGTRVPVQTLIAFLEEAKARVVASAA